MYKPSQLLVLLLITVAFGSSCGTDSTGAVGHAAAPTTQGAVGNQLGGGRNIHGGPGTAVATVADSGPNPDTSVLDGLTAYNNRSIATAVTLRQAEKLTPVDTDSLPVTADQARVTAANLRFLHADLPITCVAALLTALDILRPTATGNQLLYENYPVWICFQTRITGRGSNGAAVDVNTVTYVDAKTGAHLFTDENGS